MSTYSHPTSFTPPHGEDIAELADSGQGALSPEVSPSSHIRMNLKPFVLSPEMLTVFGVFYPTGYIVLMFPHVEQAEQAAHAQQNPFGAVTPDAVAPANPMATGGSDAAAGAPQRS